ncbi:MAG: Type 1 glutamine amidotransferase-like domain-containing protein, partial [Pseudomonadota bacterium]|nr:Type 1 glutamine amidotransferase-like domain-containing protein [Pseudomonadota bacterium]
MTRLLLASNLRDFTPKLDRVFDRPLAEMAVVCIPTAAAGEDNIDRWLIPEKAALRDRVKSFTEFDLQGKTPEQVRHALAHANIICLTGGNTYFLLEHVQKSGFAQALKPCLDHGAWYVGASAGTVLACPDIDYIRAMDKPDRAQLTDFT